jgi:hypothetical protein
MTLKSLSRILDKYESQFSSSGIQQFELLQGLPFYSLWNVGDKSTDFNHLVGLSPKEWTSIPIVRLREGTL